MLTLQIAVAHLIKMVIVAQMMLVQLVSAGSNCTVAGQRHAIRIRS